MSLGRWQTAGFSACFLTKSCARGFCFVHVTVSSLCLPTYTSDNYQWQGRWREHMQQPAFALFCFAFGFACRASAAGGVLHLLSSEAILGFWTQGGPEIVGLWPPILTLTMTSKTMSNIKVTHYPKCVKWFSYRDCFFVWEIEAESEAQGQGDDLWLLFENKNEDDFLSKCFAFKNTLNHNFLRWNEYHSNSAFGSTLCITLKVN